MHGPASPLSPSLFHLSTPAPLLTPPSRRHHHHDHAVAFDRFPINPIFQPRAFALFLSLGIQPTETTTTPTSPLLFSTFATTRAPDPASDKRTSSHDQFCARTSFRCAHTVSERLRQLRLHLHTSLATARGQDNRIFNVASLESTRPTNCFPLS